MTEHHTNVLILGSGPAGCTAGLYAARAMLAPIMVEGEQAGGQLSTTSDVENYPGFAAPITGPWLMEQMKAQAVAFGMRAMSDNIVSVDLSRRPFCLTGRNATYFCDALVICTGAQTRWTNVAGETAFRNFGVSSCATCDGFFYRQQEVAVIGGGNTAVEEALALSSIAARVTLIHRRDTLRAEAILQERLRRAPNVEIRWNTVVEEIVGSEKPRNVQGLRVRDSVTGVADLIPVDGVFVAIGHKPATELFAGQLRLTPSGYIEIVGRGTQTSVPGVFAAGDVTDEHYRQAVTAAGMGCMAAIDVERWLSGMSDEAAVRVPA
ncbi:thioredoxin-disulfide reductase [Ancylobacter sp. MQZ15Z-1]|uniref:Thioredoxin reductase n=1 Tax=Ancylobacter mangrovi TaxID=2972472 RepID=A0A9X2T374_9HYPH|nr:thioredoxin-disulfide reductase [Ancylobacter mangrovi]MCS0494661.1 thioredoxin-disulfide reductase [Ancylobacter mangrovi]